MVVCVHQIGYREAISSARKVFLQTGFNEGFRQGSHKQFRQAFFQGVIGYELKIEAHTHHIVIRTLDLCSFHHICC